MKNETSPINDLSKIEFNLYCTYLQGYMDWKKTTMGGSRNSVPDSCCLFVSPGCGSNLFEVTTTTSTTTTKTTTTKITTTTQITTKEFQNNEKEMLWFGLDCKFQNQYNDRCLLDGGFFYNADSLFNAVLIDKDIFSYSKLTIYMTVFFRFRGIKIKIFSLF